MIWHRRHIEREKRIPEDIQNYNVIGDHEECKPDREL